MVSECIIYINKEKLRDLLRFEKMEEFEDTKLRRCYCRITELVTQKLRILKGYIPNGLIKIIHHMIKIISILLMLVRLG